MRCLGLGFAYLVIGPTIAVAAIASDSAGGVAGSVTILSVGTSTILVAAPTRTGAASGYNSTDESVEVAYSGNGGLSGVSNYLYELEIERLKSEIELLKFGLE